MRSMRLRKRVEGPGAASLPPDPSISERNLTLFGRSVSSSTEGGRPLSLYGLTEYNGDNQNATNNRYRKYPHLRWCICRQ